MWGWVEAQVYTEMPAGQDFSHLGENQLRILLSSTSHSSETFSVGVKPLDHHKFNISPLSLSSSISGITDTSKHLKFESPSLRLLENLGDFTLSLAGTLWHVKRETHSLTVSEMSKWHAVLGSRSLLSPPSSASEMLSHHDPYLWTHSFHGVDHNDAPIANAHGRRHL